MIKNNDWKTLNLLKCSRYCYKFKVCMPGLMPSPLLASNVNTVQNGFASKQAERTTQYYVASERP